MPVQQSDLRLFGSGSFISTDTGTPVGGAIDRTTEMVFSNILANDNFQIVSSTQGDTTQYVNINGRDINGAFQNENLRLNGRTPVPCVNTTVWSSLAVGSKSASCIGDVAVESVTPVFSGSGTNTAASQYVTLTSPPAGIDLTNCVFRVTAGTGLGYVAIIVAYNIATGVAYLNSAPVSFDGTSVIRVSYGMVFRQVADGGTEVMTVRRPFYNVVAPAPQTAVKTVLEKVFLYNSNASQTLASAMLQQLIQDGIVISLGVDAALGASTFAAGNRIGASPVPMYSGTPVGIPGTTLPPQQGIGIWLQMILNPGANPVDTILDIQIQGV